MINTVTFYLLFIILVETKYAYTFSANVFIKKIILFLHDIYFQGSEEITLLLWIDEPINDPTLDKYYDNIG